MTIPGASMRERWWSLVDVVTAPFHWVWSRWMCILMGAYYFVLTAVGVIGFRDPSQSIAEALGGGYLTYAVGMTVVGSLAILSVFTGYVKGEVICLVGLGLLTVLHGGLLLAGGEPGYQSGLRILAGIFILPVVAYYRYNVVWTRADVRKSLRAQARTEEVARRFHASQGGE